MNVQKSKPVKVRLGDGGIDECQHNVELELEIEGELYPTDAFILPTLPYSIILGMNFLKKYHFQLNSKYLQLEKGKCASYQEEAILYTTEDYLLKPFSEHIVNTYCDMGLIGNLFCCFFGFCWNKVVIMFFSRNFEEHMIH